jgi:hypothetical protein
MDSIPIRAIHGDVTAIMAIEGLRDRYDVQIAQSYADVEKDSILFVSCPIGLFYAFKWSEKGTICLNAIAIADSGIIPEECKTQAIVLLNRGHRWNKIGDLVERAIRMYLRYQQNCDKGSHLPWGGFNSHDPRAQAWIEWWNTTPHSWDLTPLSDYKEAQKRAKEESGIIRISTSDSIPRRFAFR